ncbi:hypothetical protein E2C01_097053 [Portunus trituberculatus]|uniref:Uncharacterized protein n=1 Tax=Portunus trituberculatus TaxID=210409 RepID=A0A5B7JXA1_PORTR|nr:hypothetical protein [Portunus trituberculatus]
MSAHIAQIKRNRSLAYAGQMSQAERMVKRSRLDLKLGEEADNVAVPIPAVDRGRGDPRNILGIITARDLDTNLYQIACEAWNFMRSILKKSVRFVPSVTSD